MKIRIGMTLLSGDRSLKLFLACFHHIGYIYIYRFSPSHGSQCFETGSIPTQTPVLGKTNLHPHQFQYQMRNTFLRSISVHYNFFHDSYIYITYIAYIYPYLSHSFPSISTSCFMLLPTLPSLPSPTSPARRKPSLGICTES